MPTIDKVCCMCGATVRVINHVEGNNLVPCYCSKCFGTLPQKVRDHHSKLVMKHALRGANK